MKTKHIALAAAAALAAALTGCSGGRLGGRSIHIEVTEYGFEPAQVVIPKNADVTLVFTRTTQNTCATDLVFGPQREPHDLPLNQDVTIWLPKGQPDTLRFACGMDMVQGMVLAK